MANTTKKHKEAKKIIDHILTVKGWTNEILETALQVKKNLLTNENTPASVRNSIADKIIQLHAFFVDQQDGVVDEPEYESKKKKETPEEAMGFSIKFTGTED